MPDRSETIILVLRVFSNSKLTIGSMMYCGASASATLIITGQNVVVDINTLNSFPYTTSRLIDINAGCSGIISINDMGHGTVAFNTIYPASKDLIIQNANIHDVTTLVDIDGDIVLRNCTTTGAITYARLSEDVALTRYTNTGGVYTSLINSGRSTIATEASIRHTASGIAWKISPNVNVVSSLHPVSLPIAKVALSSGTLVTASVWLRRTDTGINGRLVCKGGQILGVSTDVTASISAAIDTWQQVTITFTPTNVGIVTFTVECWGGSTYSVYVDDFTILQA